ncbi:ricin-type beta-trefoil lectin domain protein [Streptomyces zaehneri]|uniref:ricin-type beta-trefoil lectin domain protein n=1 Tax=Streptomyces zaehneri TaxID=3051180 RepID=UPI0037D9E6F9
MTRRLPHRRAAGGALGAAAVAALLTGLNGTPASGAAVAAGQIAGIGGKCVDIAGAATADGTAVQLYDCNGSAAQQWTVMNGITDNSETVTVADFRTILAYAQQRHLARLTFWSVNRDRPCTGGGADTCSGIAQQPWDFTRVFAQYAG